MHEAKLPDLWETETRSLKSGTTFLHEVTKPTQRLKTFDGKTSWDAYKTQFEIVAEINGWDDNEKAAFLAASPSCFSRRPAVNVLNCLSESNRRSYNALLQALDTLCQSELNRATLRNRIRRRDESLPELAGDIERLV
jgi:hypothetical protein